jgi:hypothetical protein
LTSLQLSPGLRMALRRRFGGEWFSGAWLHVAGLFGDFRIFRFAAFSEGLTPMIAVQSAKMN